MIHAVIIDDEENSIKSLELVLAKYAPEVKVVATSTNPKEGIVLVNNYRPNIVFLDIYMPELNGFDVLNKLEYQEFYLIFTTAYREYALKALKANAFVYLLKPIDWEELTKTLERIKTKESKNHRIEELLSLVSTSLESQKLHILLATKTGIERVLSDDILYIEANSNQSFVYLVNGMLRITNKSLKEYEEMLCVSGQYFFRAQNSYIVNLQEVVCYSKEAGGTVVMMNGKKIPVSKSQKVALMQLFNLDDSLG